MKKVIRSISAVVGLCMMLNTNSALSFAENNDNDSKNTAVDSVEYSSEK